MTPVSRNVLVDRLGKDRTLATDLLWGVAFSFLTALLAQLEIRFPFTPVPLTGQTLAVLLSGALLGARRGFLSQALYLAEGVAGLPVFAGGAASVVHLLGPTGGYLWSFPLAAALLGWLVERGASRSALRLAASLLVADVVILGMGALWLSVGFTVPFAQAMLLGFYPFLLADVMKIALIGLSLPLVMKRLARADGSAL
jgi:biotin transport system substrate-specific component